ncbi:MAG: response regulator transcription factor [Pseudomonadota bacterium]
MRLLLVEDDPDLVPKLVDRLSEAGFVVDKAGDGETGQYMAETGSYSAIVLDIGLPVRDGLSVLENLRSNGRDTPTLLLTARDGWRDKVRGLRLGADDYLAKPFESEELLARLEALIRRAHGQSEPTLKVGPLEIDVSARIVLRDGEGIHVTANEYRALSFLAINRGRVVTKIELAEQIWQQETDRELNAIEVTIARLRKKIGADVIETKRGHGYVIT